MTKGLIDSRQNIEELKEDRQNIRAGVLDAVEVPAERRRSDSVQREPLTSDFIAVPSTYHEVDLPWPGHPTVACRRPSSRGRGGWLASRNLLWEDFLKAM